MVVSLSVAKNPRISLGGSRSWRQDETAGSDIPDCWGCKKDWGGGGLVQILDLMNGLETYAGPGHWNDPDMLEVGNGGMSKEEYRTHFSMWAMLAAPLLAGNNVANMTADTKEILLNKEVIAIDQDALRQQGRRVKKTGDLEVWSKQLQDGGRAVALGNRGASTAKISVAWTDIGYPDAVSAKVRDLWTKKESSAVKSGY